MEMKKLAKEVKGIQMPDEMKDRIMDGCYNKKVKHVMFKKPMVAVASMALCFCLVGVTALATAGKLEGFFKDITRWDGAVIGTSYEQATDEINLQVISVSDELKVTLEFVDPSKPPYAFFETFGIETYKIVDADGKTVVEGKGEMSQITEEKMTFLIPVSGLSGGNYKLVIPAFVGGSKADQPLTVYGNWECEFSY